MIVRDRERTISHHVIRTSSSREIRREKLLSRRNEINNATYTAYRRLYSDVTI